MIEHFFGSTRSPRRWQSDENFSRDSQKGFGLLLIFSGGVRVVRGLRVDQLFCKYNPRTAFLFWQSKTKKKNKRSPRMHSIFAALIPLECSRMSTRTRSMSEVSDSYCSLLFFAIVFCLCWNSLCVILNWRTIYRRPIFCSRVILPELIPA